MRRENAGFVADLVTPTYLGGRQPVAVDIPEPRHDIPPNQDARQEIVQERRADYFATGRQCPCPYDRAIDNSQCGGRSAYTRRKATGIHEPLYCYIEDVPAALRR